MTVAACPSCREEVTIPADALADSIVQCPLCGEERQLSEFLAQLPPTLIVKVPGIPGISTGSPPPNRDTMAGIVPHGAAAGPADPAVSAQMASEDAVARRDSSEFDLVTEGDSVESVPRAMQRGDGTRPPRKQPAWEFAKIAAGALLALPLAQLILWWLPGAWQRDPFQLGPAVGRVLPWMVPANYQPTGRLPRVSDEDSTASGTAEAFSQRVFPSPGRPLTGAPNGGNREMVAQPDGLVPSQRHSAPRGGADAVPTVRGKSLDRSGLPDNDQYSAADLRDVLETVEQASADWDRAHTQPETAREQLDHQLYAALAEMGRAITFVRPDDLGVRDQAESLHTFLQSLVQQPKKLAMLGNHSAAWLDRTDRDTDGVLLFGTVKQIRLRGQLFETEMELASRQRRTVSVLSRVDPKNSYAPRSTILMLGVIVEDPQTNLPGYEGDLSRAVLGAFPVTVLP